MSMIDKDLDFLVECVTQAGAEQIMPRFRNLISGDISEKTSTIDLVTEADLLAERQMTAALRLRFPTALVVGEEACETDKTLIGQLAAANLAFVIDPVDGTYNFASGLPIFGTMMSVIVHGETVAGIIHDPILGDTVIATKGGGVSMTRRNGNSTRIRVAPTVPLSEMVGIMSWGYMPVPLRGQVAGNMAKIKLALTLNCSAYEYWMAASGRVHFIGHQNLKPWDHLAGVLCHQEAGGYTAKFDGTPYKPGETTGGIISAPDEDSWQMIRREIIGL
jgi:myo-inositol-1(or 4)-monophosphatase